VRGGADREYLLAAGLALWRRNCGDTEYYQVMFNSVFQSSATSPNVDGYIGDGREMGLTLSVDF
jgi:hypothetical protein